jgi:hypothetical protein
MAIKGWRNESARHSLAARGIKTRCAIPRTSPVKSYSGESASKSLADLKDSVREAVREAVDYYIKENPGMSRDDVEGTIDDDGTLTEVYDSQVPIYDGDLMLLASLPEVYNYESELGPAFDGSPTLTNITAGKIYELLGDVAREEVGSYLDELETEGKFDESVEKDD